MDGAARQQADRSEIAGLWAAGLSVAEIGVGSLMHALHVPLTGTLLSLNQAAFLSRFVKLNRYRHDIRSITLDVSTVTALIKSFAPIGKRLTPMLAISVQGLLFTIGLWIFGVNLLGVLIGSCLLAAWGIVQPAFLAGIMYRSLSLAEQERVLGAWGKMTEDLPWLSSIAEMHGLMQVIVLIFSLKCLLAILLTTIAWRSSTSKHSLWRRWEQWLNRYAIHHKPHLPIVTMSRPDTIRTTLRLALRDLRHPMIWLSLGLLISLSIFLDSDYRATIWMGMRALGGIYLFYVALRLIPWDHVLGSKTRFAAPLRHALNVLRRENCASDRHQP
jgi:hypothetical protein